MILVHGIVINGADEVDCPRNPCRPNGHPCILPNNYNMTCLPLSRFNDGIIDCLGAYDERCLLSKYVHHIQNQRPIVVLIKQYVFLRDILYAIMMQCGFNEDQRHSYKDFPNEPEWCSNYFTFPSSQTLNLYSYLCSLEADYRKHDIVYFTLKNHLNYPIQTPMINDNLLILTTMKIAHVDVPNFDLGEQMISHQSNIFCNRGIHIYSNDVRET